MFKIINKESKLSGKMILAGCCRVASNTSGWVPIGCGCWTYFVFLGEERIWYNFRLLGIFSNIVPISLRRNYELRRFRY